MSSIKIFQTFHKEHVHAVGSKWVQPVGVAGFMSDGFVSDATGQNIAALNSSYCELTAQYWAWKNTQTDYVGFCHYRRYMRFKHDGLWMTQGNFGVPVENDFGVSPESMLHYLTDEGQLESLKSLLSFWDVITPRAHAMAASIEEQYLGNHERAPWDEFLRVIKLVYSAHPACEAYFRLASHAPVWNMFVMRRDLFEHYCSDLFTVIDAVYQRIGTPFGSYHNRYPGFLAERFLGFWLAMKRARAYEVPVLVFS